MKMLIVTHATFESPGSIKVWADKNGFETTEVKPYAGEEIPDINDFDFIVVMGGPQSPLAMESAPYLKDEIEMLTKALKSNKRIIGVCLGAQLIAEALGAKTEKSPNREIGCYPLEIIPNSDPVFGHVGSQVEVMHWHSDMPGIPEGAELLAKSEGCPRQIYRYGDRVYGFQCHFELTKELVQGMIKHCPDDLKPGNYVMNVEELLNVDYSPINQKMDMVLDHLNTLK